MILVWDNVDGNPGLIWDDDNECVTWLYPNAGNTESGSVQDGYPFRIMVIPYEMIQYIDVLMSSKDAHEYITNHKDEMVGDEKQIKKLYASTVGKKFYTGTISEYPHRELNPRIGE